MKTESSSKDEEEKDNLLGDLGGFNSIEELDGAKADKAVPSSYRVSRKFELIKQELEGGVLKRIIGDAKPVEVERVKSKNDYISLTNIKQVDYALQQTLYNLSYINGNKEDYTGYNKKGELLNKIQLPPIEIEGKLYHYGEIVTSLADLTSIAFGVDKPNGNQRKTVREVLEYMAKEGVTIKMSNGDTLTKRLIFIKDEVEKANGAKFYDIVLHPLYCADIKNNFGLLPQNVMGLIGRLSTEKIDLVSLLAIQDRKKDYKVKEETLISKLGLTDYWKKDKKKAKKKLEGVLDDLVKAGNIKGTVEEGKITSRGWNWEGGYITIQINPNFIKDK